MIRMGRLGKREHCGRCPTKERAIGMDSASGRAAGGNAIVCDAAGGGTSSGKPAAFRKATAAVDPPEAGSGAAGLETAAVIVAAGKSSRMGGRVRKPFLKVAGREVLAWTIEALARVRHVKRFVIVTRPEDKAEAMRIVRRAAAAIAGREVRFAGGGAIRRDSVLNGLKACGEGVRIVAVHDAARPLASPELIERAIETAARSGGAILACPIRDTVKLVDAEGRIVRTIPRDGLYAAQTPQVFRLDMFRRLAERIGRKGLDVTDDAAILEACGKTVLVVDSGPENLKITTPEDIGIAEALLEARAWRRVNDRGVSAGPRTLGGRGVGRRKGNAHRAGI